MSVGEHFVYWVGKKALKALRDGGSIYDIRFDVDEEIEEFAGDLLLTFIVERGKTIVKRVGAKNLALGTLSVAMLPLIAPLAAVHAVWSHVGTEDPDREGVFADDPYHGLLNI